MRRNLGYSRLETARTTEGGAQPPGLTVEIRQEHIGMVISRTTWALQKMINGYYDYMFRVDIRVIKPLIKLIPVNWYDITAQWSERVETSKIKRSHPKMPKVTWGPTTHPKNNTKTSEDDPKRSKGFRRSTAIHQRYLKVSDDGLIIQIWTVVRQERW